MFDINVPLPQWIASQIIGAIILVIVIFAFQAKTKARTLVFFCCGSALWIVSTLLVENYVGTAVYGVGFLRNLALLWLATKGKNAPKWVSSVILAICIALTIAAIIPTRTWWFDWILLAATVFRVYGAWREGIHWIRTTALVFLPLIIFNHLWFANYTGAIVEFVGLVSIIVFYARFLRKRKTVDKCHCEEPATKQSLKCH